MLTFLAPLAMGALVGWVAEQQCGTSIVRWYRQRRMLARVARRQGRSPWSRD
jgi:hypothetical protein